MSVLVNPSPQRGSAATGGQQAGALWDRYLTWLGEHAPAGHTLLNPPAAEERIRALEARTGFRVPDACRAGWRRHDGQRPGRIGVFAGFRWLSVRDVHAEWERWALHRADDHDANRRAHDLRARSFPRRAIQLRFSMPGWLPLFRAAAGEEYVGVDLQPGPLGRSGQVINFGRGQERRFVAAPELTGLLDWLVEQAEHGALTVAEGNLRHRDGLLAAALREATGAYF